LYFEKVCFADQYRKTSEKMHKIKKKAESGNVFLEMRKERMEKPNVT